MKTKLSSTLVGLEANTARFIALGLLAVTVLVSLAGCKGQPHATTDINPAGAYTLVSVDGKNVPCSLTHQGTAMTIKSGIFTINDDGRCSSLMTLSVPPHNDINREVKATYTRQGAELTMRWAGAGTTKGNIDGNMFTMTNEGMVLSYQK